MIHPACRRSKYSLRDIRVDKDNADSEVSLAFEPLDAIKREIRLPRSTPLGNRCVNDRVSNDENEIIVRSRRFARATRVSIAHRVFGTNEMGLETWASVFNPIGSKIPTPCVSTVRGFDCEQLNYILQQFQERVLLDYSFPDILSRKEFRAASPIGT